MKSLDPEGLKQLLIRSWMTHDAMWFRHRVEACGIEQTSRINTAAAITPAVGGCKTGSDGKCSRRYAFTVDAK